MGGKNRTRKCKACGDSVDGLYTSYCYPCIERRRKEKHNARFLERGVEPDTCVDCGRKTANYYAMRCCACDRVYRANAKLEKSKRPRRAWYRECELSQYPISDPGW